ncbi:hypothetical protein [Streptomyces sp. HNS054]|uniref:hypothetical protein n=1 Tax=Streptomyces sp. HNS054 TaxID=1662446 RepID=UPI00069D2EE6|nr:hypothetical protein [Streptomyces sp. HNS054]WPW19189.1 hypothetical protein UBV09_10850 [Streptomyces griseoincarnatus]
MRRVKPSRRDLKKLTAFEKRTGWRYQIIATNIPAHHGLSGVPGSGQVWFLNALYRDHAGVEDRIKAIKRLGFGLLPSKSWHSMPPGSWPPRSLPTSTHGPGSSSCTTNPNSPPRSRRRSG